MSTLRITIVGAGRVGSALGTGLLRIGHQVSYALRDGSARELPAGATSRPLDGAADDADLTILAVPFGVAAQSVREVAPPAGAVIVDATNPFGAPIPDGRPSGAAYVAAAAGPDRHIVKAFNVLGAEHMAEPQLADGSRPVLPVAADDDRARALVAGVARDLGFDAVEVGGLEVAGLVEEAARYWGLLATAGGLGRDVVLVARRRSS
jgi:predicted dinucleotide-binding enzyme